MSSTMQELESRIARLENQRSFHVPITSFAPEPFEVLKSIPAVLEQSDEEYIATFFDANIGASGSNEVEAIENLKDLLLSRFDYLDALSPPMLAPPVEKQLAVLREFIRRKP